MADKGIIFSAAMVRALLDGRKTQTRRLLSLRGYRGFREFGPSDTAGYDWHFRRADACWCDVTEGRLRELLPYASGDRLYVRENFQMLSFGDYAPTKHWPADVRYAATDTLADSDKDVRGYPWRPCIHMPRFASRLWLEVTDVQVQRVAGISHADAKAEGVDWQADYGLSPREHFAALWNSLHGKPGERWEDSPWIVAVTFTVHHGNIDARGA